MRPFFITFLLATVATAVLQQACVEKIPEGANPSEYFLCREHPAGHDLPMLETVTTQRTQTAEEVAQECGRLGIMKVPEGADPSLYRKCRDHPASGTSAGPEEIAGHEAGPGNSGVTIANPMERRRRSDLAKKACYYVADYGCSRDDWCWHRCGQPRAYGKWCWVAVNGGRGDWARCSTAEQCNVPGMGCGGKCSC